MLFISACAATKTTVAKYKTKVETLTITDIVQLDTTIFIPAEKASLFIPVEKVDFKSLENPKVFTQKKGSANITVTVDRLGITATAKCDSIAKQLQFYKTKITALTKLDSKSEIKEEIKKGYSFLELIFYITAFSIVSFVAAYLLKTFKII